MESECECCGDNTNNYYFGMCAGCIRTLPLKDKRIAELEAKLGHQRRCTLKAREAEDKAIAKLEALKKHTGLLNSEYEKTWEVLRTYNPLDIELEYIGFEDIK